MGNDSIPFPKEVEHLGVPVIAAQWPAMMKDDGLRGLGAPVLVENRHAVIRGNRAHLVLLGSPLLPSTIFHPVSSGVIVPLRSRARSRGTRGRAFFGRSCETASADGSAKPVSGGGEEHARAAGLAPDPLVAGTGLSPVVVARIQLLVVDPELAVQQIQLFDPGMGVRRIGGPRREAYEHADAVFVGIRREQLEGEAGRGFFPLRFSPWQGH